MYCGFTVAQKVIQSLHDIFAVSLTTLLNYV